MSKIDIISQEWNDLVFEGRNKKYGGYFLRKTSDKRHITALIIVCVVALFAFYSPKIFKILIPVGTVIDTVDTSVEMSDFEKPIDEPEKKEPEIEVKQLIELRKTIQFTDFKAVDKKDIEVIDVAQVFENDAAVSNVTQAGSTDVEIPIDVHVQGPEKVVNDTIYKPFEVDQQPSAPYDWGKYLQNKLRYPAAMQENGIQGKVIVQFLVSKSGKITNVKVIKSLDPAGDKEAIRVVESADPWIPGKRNGEPVQTLFTLPIVYKLQ